MLTKILGTGHYVPESRLTNNDLAGLVETSDEWISERTGIRCRHVADKETTVSMALKSAMLAIETAQIDIEQLDLIIVGTISADDLLPSTACSVQGALGAKNAIAFDVNAACSGFMYAFTVADSMMRNGLGKNALIIGVETLSKITDWSDRGTCVLFGDGAGAAVISLSDDEKGMLSVDIGSDGSRANTLFCKSRSNANPVYTDETVVKNDGTIHPGYITMDGQAVFKFAVRQVPKSIEKVLENSGLTVDDIDLFILHQANMRIINSIAKRLRADIEKFPHNMEEYGNTSAASIPILLDECIKNNTIKPGMNVIIAGFGAGLTWSAALIKF